MYQITNECEYEAAQKELSALMEQSTGINALRISEIQLAINAYLLK